MALQIEPYNHLKPLLLAGSVPFDGGEIKALLVDSSYAFDAADTVLADVAAAEIAGAGYVAGGKSLTGVSIVTTTPATATLWAADSPVAFGDVVRPTADNGRLYLCVVPGTTDAAEPVWPTIGGGSVNDNGVVWLEVGGAVSTLDAANLVWAAATITARRAIIYRDATVGGIESPLLFSVLLDDTPGDVSSVNSDFTLAWSTAGILIL
ncbi:MAG: hypothetical protein C0621_07465 [Desulfuromonas sp.]|nr:MAG: hypothetical protein C0621_07465 [Desulfuromonas sp.]